MAVDETPVTTVTLLTYSGILGMVAALIGAWVGGNKAKQGAREAQEHALALGKADRRERMINRVKSLLAQLNGASQFFDEWQPDVPISEHALASLETVCLDFNQANQDLYLLGNPKLEYLITDTMFMALRYARLARQREAYYARAQESVLEGEQGVAHTRALAATAAASQRSALAADLTSLAVASNALLNQIDAMEHEHGVIPPERG